MLNNSKLYNIFFYTWIVSYVVLAGLAVSTIILDIKSIPLPHDLYSTLGMIFIFINAGSFIYLNDHLPVHKDEDHEGKDHGSKR